MKKLFITSGVCFLLGSAAMAQTPGKATAKKQTAVITVVPAPSVAPENNTDAKKREAEKKKYFEALKAGKAENAENNVPQNDPLGTKKKKVN